MARKPYSTGVTPELHAELMISPEARAERKAEQTVPRFIGEVMLGRMRAENEAVFTPTVLPKSLAESLGRVLKNRDEVLRDQFTEKLPTLRDRYQYQRYVSGGNRHTKRYESDPEERKQARLARKRQTQHVADNLHRNTWLQWQSAKLFKASLEHVRSAKIDAKVPDEQALRFAASAIEDFGYCLQDKPVLRKVAHSYYVPGRLIGIGQYAAAHPSSLLAQEPVTFLLVQREQERREALWGGNLECYEDPEFGGYRRTADDQHDEQINDALISSWQLK